MKIFQKKVENDHEENKSNNDFINPVRVASITNIVLSEVFQDILKENKIPFICRQQGAGGYLKIILGGGFVPDDIYVDESNFEKAKELYDVYIDTQLDYTENDEE